MQDHFSEGAEAQPSAWSPVVSAQAGGCICSFPPLLVQLVTNSEHSEETHRQRQDVLIQLATKAALIKNCLQLYLHTRLRVQIIKSHFSFLAHKDRSILMQAYKEHYQGSQAHMHSQIPPVISQIPHLPRTTILEVLA